MLLLLRGFSNVTFVFPWASSLQGNHYTPWKWPAKPWERIHIDFFEKGKLNFLIVVDAYSKWLEVTPTGSMTSLKTIEVLRSLFARCRIPEEVVSDNGPQLASEEFSQFLKQNGVKFTRVPPYHPASKGAAERSVQTAKTVLTKQVLDGKANSLSLEHRLANFIISNRSKPHTVTGQSPAELFLGRQIRNCFTLLKRNLNRAMEDQQLRQKEHHDEGRVKRREFKLNEVVLVRCWRRDVERWIPGRIAQVKGPCTYLVRCEDQIRFVHVDHLKSALWIQSLSSWKGGEDSNYARNFPSSQAKVKSGAWSPSEPLVNISEAGGVPDAGDVGEQDTTEVTPESSLGDALEGASLSGTPLSPHPALRYPSRERRPPRRLICEM